jgi:hypothetical protein
VIEGSTENAVRFVDLSGYPTFFGDLESCFPQVTGSFSRSNAPETENELAEALEVQDVGDFEASFVPGRKDFLRLDPRFRLPESFWQTLPLYADWGFAVFKLRAPAVRQRPTLLQRMGLARPPYIPPRTPHPMAFDFPTRCPRDLFFPTVHMHDGQVHARAEFDHVLYGQMESAEWIKSEAEAIGTVVDAERARGLIDPSRPAWKLIVKGERTNEDTWA